MKTNTITFSTQNRRMAFRQALTNDVFSIVYKDHTMYCLNISIQGCQIPFHSDLASSTFISCKLQYGNITSKEIQAKIVRREADKLALHFIKIDSKTRTAIEEYLLEIQKKELQQKKAISLENKEKQLLNLEKQRLNL